MTLTDTLDLLVKFWQAVSSSALQVDSILCAMEGLTLVASWPSDFVASFSDEGVL